MTTQSGASPDEAELNPGEKIANLLGLLIAAFVGALNFFGLRSGELSAILRSEAPRVTLVFGLTLAAMAAALASFFFSKVHRTAPLSAWGAFLFCLSVGAFSIALVPVPGFTETWALVLVCVFGALLLVAAWILFWLGRKRGHQSGLPRKLVLISCSVILLSTAVLAAARLETRSQVQATYPQLGATVNVAKGAGELSLHMKASKMADGDRFLFWIQGFPREIPMAKTCKMYDETPCVQNLCNDREEDDPCRLIGTGTVNPDALGKVEQQVSTSFSARTYQFLVVDAYVCQQRASEGCDWSNKNARLYLSVSEE